MNAKAEGEKAVIGQWLSKLLESSERDGMDGLVEVMPRKDFLDLETLFVAVYCVVSDFLALAGGQGSPMPK